MATTNDAMYEKLRALYPNAGATLGDLLYKYWSDSGATSIATTRTNLVTNPNFEVNLSTWNATGGSSTRITTDFYSGVACLQQTKVAGRTEVILLETIPVPVVGGRTYTVSAYFKVPAGQESMNAGIRILWYDAAGAQIPPTFIDGTYATLTNTHGWQRRTFTGVAPANAVSIRSYFGQKDSGTAGQTFLLDAVMIEEASTALPYFDGTYVNNYQGYGLSTKAWNGAVNNSPSTASWFVGDTRTNLVFNPNFEVDTSNWGADGFTTLVRSTADFYVGTASGLVTITNNTGTAGINNLSSRSNATAGLSYTASTYAKLVSGTAFSYIVVLYFYDAASNIISTASSTGTTIGAVWERKSVTAIAPVNTTSIGLGIFRNTALTGTCSFYVDGIMIEQTSSALPYFDGTFVEPYAGYGSYSKTWNGTANASSSTAIWFTGNSRRNLVTNPSFETNASLWTPVSSTLTRVAGTFGSGAWVGQCVSTITAASFYATPDSITVSGGTTLTASSTVLSTVGTRNYKMYFQWFNGATFLSDTLGTAKACATPTRLSVTGTAPANTTRCRVVIAADTAGAIGDAFQVDSVLCEESSTLLPYFDGTYADPYAGYTITQQGWAGTANASTSSANWFKGVGSGLANRGALQYDYYVSKGAVGTTLGDLANDFWSNTGVSVSNLRDELGNNLLLEDGSFMLLEVGNG